jgi:hypothetical protein
MKRTRPIPRLIEAKFSERFAATLPQFLVLLEGEWTAKRGSLNALAEESFRQAHRGLGRLNEMLDDQE